MQLLFCKKCFGGGILPPPIPPPGRICLSSLFQGPTGPFSLKTAQGLPARSSLKLSHRLNFRALRTHWPVFRALRTPGGKSVRKEFLLSRGLGGPGGRACGSSSPSNGPEGPGMLRFAKIPAQGLPARSSLKMCHRHIFRALRTPRRTCRRCGFYLEELRPLQTSRGFLFTRTLFHP